MAKRDRLTIQTVSGEKHEIVATRDGGSVEYEPPGRNSKMFRFMELNAATPPQEITVLMVAENDVAWIMQDVIPLQEWRERK